MEDFLFYLNLGLTHVLDSNAYDHILFLTALAIPFTFARWKQVLALATVFTITHCVSLALSVYEILTIDAGTIEFLIPVTILLTAIFNLLYLIAEKGHKSMVLHLVATSFFGLVHGFGFSNYFKMLMAEETHKTVPLLSFAVGIEIAQLIVVTVVLAIIYVILSIFKVKQPLFMTIASLLVILITIPLLIATFPF